MKTDIRYRLLAVGEIVGDGDEEFVLAAGWCPVGAHCVGKEVENDDMPVRRAIARRSQTAGQQVMDLGKALEIVWKMAKSLYHSHGEFCGPAKCPADATTAMDTVEDFIVNHFAEEDEGVCAECGHRYFVTPEGTTHHVGDGPDGIDHDADAGHVAYGNHTEQERFSALLEAMERHGNAEGTETQLGDAEEFLRLAFESMSRTQRAEFLDSQAVNEFIEREGGEGEM